MALFDPPRPGEREEIVGSDAATRALSVTAVENDFVAGVYENIAWFYDITFGPALHPGRVDAIERMSIKPGDRVLEVGVIITDAPVNTMRHPVAPLPTTLVLRQTQYI